MIEELQSEGLRLRERFNAAETADRNILHSAILEVEELLGNSVAGYPPLMHDWLLLLWELHPYNPESPS